VDNWNYVKKALVRKNERVRHSKKRARCRHVTDVIDDREKNPWTADVIEFTTREAFLQ